MKKKQVLAAVCIMAAMVIAGSSVTAYAADTDTSSAPALSAQQKAAAANADSDSSDADTAKKHRSEKAADGSSDTDTVRKPRSEKTADGEDNTPAILYVSTTLDAVGSAVTIIRIQLAIVTALSLAAAFVLAWFIARRFSLPVAQLSEKANSLGESGYPKDFNSGFCAELDDLSVKLDKTSDKLIESQNFQTELLANVSHDLRTPLTMIKGYAEMIKDTSWDDEEQCAADIAVIVRETDRLTNLVNEILEYSELKTRDVSESFDDIDLSAVIEKVCENYSNLSRQRGETVEVQTEKNIIVHGSAQRIERAVYNLIDNAFRHADDKTVTVRLSKNGENARIEVIDRGRGIPKEECEHIFDRYYTFRKRGGRGVSGLGLAIVKQTAQMHGGTCFIESTEGKGSTFGIEMPIIKNK